MMSIWINLSLAYGTYLLGVISPGPSNLAIMQHSLQYGRRAGLATALGVCLGSVWWGVLSSLGLGGVLLQYPRVLDGVGLFGGCYLAWLSWRVFSVVQQPSTGQSAQHIENTSATGVWRFFLYGLGLHLTNPKALFVWVSIITLGLPRDTNSMVVPLLIVAGCAIMGFSLFSLMAIMFSTPRVAKVYNQHSRLISCVMALLFLCASGSLFYRSLSKLFL